MSEPRILEIMGHVVDLNKITSPVLRRTIRHRTLCERPTNYNESWEGEWHRAYERSAPGWYPDASYIDGDYIRTLDR